MEERAESSSGGEEGGLITYCVTGATGYIGSWLVKSLLQRGYRVHATVRDPVSAKSLHLLTLCGGGDRLRLFRADLQEEGSFDKAVDGCNGVFHVAASMELSVVAKENVDSYVQTNIIDPAIKGTLNLLKTCFKTKSVKRVIFTSSISTMTAKDSAGKWRPVVDESCQTPIDHVWNTKASGWVYVLSKLLSEEAAFQFAKENGIDLVSVVTTTVAGPFLTPAVPSSIRVLLSPITGFRTLSITHQETKGHVFIRKESKTLSLVDSTPLGDPEFFPILSAVSLRMGSIALVHIEDICSAHIFLMGNFRAEGRYICCAQSCVRSELVDCLANAYPCSNIQRLVKEEHGPVPSRISSKKLQDLGFTYEYGLQDIIHHTVGCCVDYGFLSPIRK